MNGRDQPIKGEIHKFEIEEVLIKKFFERINDLQGQIYGFKLHYELGFSPQKIAEETKGLTFVSFTDNLKNFKEKLPPNF